MAFDEYLAERISHVLKSKRVTYEGRKMMGGYVFMVDSKILCGTHIDKKFGDSLLNARIGEVAYEEEIQKDVCLPMDFTGRPMKGYIYITPDGFDLDLDFDYWIQLCLNYNPLAKQSKKQKKK